MITNLHIRNFGIINEIEINFNQGLNVLTGETGAGKSLIMNALRIIAGGRFSKDMIRNGEEYAFVEMGLFLPNHVQSIDGNIILSREIYSNGRNQCKINGRLVTVNELKEFMQEILEMHGQRESNYLLTPSLHQKYLDNFIGKEIEILKEKYKEKYARYQQIKFELKNNYGDEREKRRTLDLLKYQSEEIENAKLKIGEEEELEEKRKKFLNQEKIENSVREADEAIYEIAIEAVNNGIKALSKIENMDDKYVKTNQDLKNIYYELQEIGRDIHSFGEEEIFDETERDKIEIRLDELKNLKRKYGNTTKEILEYKEEIDKQIEEIENCEQINQKYKEELNELEQDMEKDCICMHKLREEYSEKLSQCINSELKELEMKESNFSITIESLTDFNETGKDNIEIWIQTNKGEEKKQLDKIVSGGELSRIMLAMKKVFADSDEVPILTFDEIDTGISGKTVKAVSEKLKEISKNHQVICISHSASVAAVADYNYSVCKKVEEDRTNTQIQLLNEKEVIEEIAKISSGEVNEASLQYAYELRNKKVS